MKHRLFTIVSAVSLLMCVATCVLWVRSYRISDGFLYSQHGNISFGRVSRGRIGIRTVYGRGKLDGFIIVRWQYVLDCDEPMAPGAFGSGSQPQQAVSFRHFGIIVSTDDQDYIVAKNPPAFRSYPARLIVIPFWLPFVLTALPLWSAMCSRLRRLSAGHPAGACRSCGYDLRATPDRCPECGTVPAGAGK